MQFLIVVTCLVTSAIAAPSMGTGRIINGTNAVDGQFPYQVSMHYDGEHQCGGSILDEYTILCAAHCVDEFDVTKMTIKLGNVALSKQTEEHQVASFIQHADYNKDNYPYQLTNDLSILKLKTPIVFRDGVQPVKLRQTNLRKEDVVLSGWGTLSYLGDIPDILQYVGLKTTTTEECQAKIPDWAITDDALCAYSKPDQGACHGDSGGPLVDLNGEQVGIVSWATLPCGLGVPDVYMRIFPFLDWIEKNRH